MRRAVADLGLPLIQFGVRALCLEEVEAREQYGVRFHDAAELAAGGIRRSRAIFRSGST